MIANFKESRYGSIIPNCIEIKKLESKSDIGSIVCLLNNDILVEGNLKIYKNGDSKSEIHAIEIKEHFQYCIDKNYQDFGNFNSKMEFIIFVKNIVPYIKIDDFGFVTNVEKITYKEVIKYKKSDLVLLRIVDLFKAARILKSGRVNGIPCHEVQLCCDECQKEKIVLDKNVIDKLLDGDGNVNGSLKNLDLVDDCDIVEDKIGDSFEYLQYKGILRWKGRVNGLKCVGIEDENSSAHYDFSYHCKRPYSYWIMVPFEKDKYRTQRKHSSFSDENIKENTVDDVGSFEPPTSISRNQSLNSDSEYSKNETPNEYPDEGLGLPLAIMRIEKNKSIDPIDPNDSIRSIYTLIHSMFIFTELFDSLLLEGKHKDFCDSLVSIVASIRRNNPVLKDSWMNLLNIMKRFLPFDKDLDDFLDVIDFHFKMFHIVKNETVDVNVIDFSNFDKPSSTIKMNEILTMHCLDKKMWFFKTPKCLIIKGKEGSNMPILSKLDITKLTVECSNSCSVCSSEAALVCFNCSSDKMDITYFCKDHKTHCKHTSKPSISEWNKTAHKMKGKVELELFSIICKNGSDYHAYVKTLDVKNGWLRFSVMGTGDCTVTAMDLQSYFSEKWDRKKNNKDRDNLEDHMVLCFYKYPPLEFYWNGF